MLTAFLRRQKPDSTSANPAFMKNTRKDAITTQRVSKVASRAVTLFLTSSIVGGAGGAAD
jgi:hypothetical protein